jgi:hypothetical protein
MKRKLIGQYLLSLVLALPLIGCAQMGGEQAAERAAYKEKIAKAETIYNNACKNIAGEKIYKTVPDVEGILLMKVRPNATDKEYSDPSWPGAAFALEADGDSYIMSFLGYEQSTSHKGNPVTPEHRGVINPESRPDSPSNLPGYRWVDIVDPTDGKRYRYTLVKKITGKLDTTAVNVRIELAKNPNMDLNIYRIVLDRQPAPDPAPRYAVTFEDHVIPEERALWVASSTVKAVDLKTKDVLGEMVRYAMSYVHVASSSNPGPWLTETWCPAHGGSVTTYTTRYFADQILIPAKEK